MKGFSPNRLVFGLLAAAAAVAGALGIGLPWAGTARAPTVLVDLSASCAAPDPMPPGARILRDSRLGPALRAARAAGAERIRLFTDACDPAGVAPPPPGVPVDVILQPRRDDVGILAVRTPAEIPANADFAVEIVLGRTVGGAGEVAVEVRLQRDGERVGQARRLRLGGGQRRRVRFRDRVEREGLVTYRALLRAPGESANDTREAVARIGARPALLAVGAPLPEGFSGRSVNELGAEPLDAFDAILVAGAAPDRRTQERIAAAVHGGAGLVAWKPRGFAGKPLDTVLPLTEAPPGGRAVLLLLDFSGSMRLRKADLLAAVAVFRERFAPDDRVAFVAFRDEPVLESGWSTANGAQWALGPVEPRGNTRLGPALDRAEALLEGARGALRRLFVVSDGEWKDPDPAELATHVARLRDDGVHCGLLLLGDADGPRVFPRTLRRDADIAAALDELDDAAPDRTVAGPLGGTREAGPSWLEGALPLAGDVEDIVRYWRRGAGEFVAWRAGEIPLAGAWRRGGKVVQVAAAGADVAGLLRAVLRERPDDLRAWREGGSLVVESRGESDAANVNGALVPLRAFAPGVRRGTLAAATPTSLTVTVGATAVVVSPAAREELAGLDNRPDIAAALARATGGRLFVDGPPPPERGTFRLVSLTLLVGALFVLVSAIRRRSA